MRKFLASAALCAAMAVASPAFAAPTITFAPTQSDGSTSATFSDTGMGAGSFTDMFTFSLPAGLVSSTISSIFTTSQMNNADFSSVTLNGTAYNIVSQGQVEFRTLVSDPIASGLQTLSISGTSGGNSSYAGTLSFAAASAVPEPATWAMMILGMGAIGFSMRLAKRRSDEKFDAKIKRITDGAFA